MNDEYSKYELLGKALDADFGNIYEYNLKPGQVAGFDLQEWTPELRQAVKQYLLHDLPEDTWESLIQSDEQSESTGSTVRETQVDRLIERLQPAEIAVIIRSAAVATVPTLRQLIGHLTDWPSEDERNDAETWLEAHGADLDWRRLVVATDHENLATIRMPSGRGRQLAPDDLVHALTPVELVNAWEYAVGPADTDLTDAEWQLLVHHLGSTHDQRRGTRIRPAIELAAKRRRFSALRFKVINQVDWTQLPPRYGSPTANYQMYRRDRADGLFVRLRNALAEHAEAQSIVAWLDQVNVDDQVTGRGGQ
ncbi:transposase [Nocardia fluminea]|uniref:transposase n=1 Tax=Nocardia fluminea TaxID=134984 RepID=UPI0036491CE3